MNTQRKQTCDPQPPSAPITITRIGAEGDGVAALPDGAPVYLPRTLPGEQVTPAALARRGDGWHGEAAAIPVASPDRVAAPCQHFGACGGCVLQHWRDAPYRAWKAGLLEAALRHAGFAPPAVTLHPGLPGERRRLDFAVRRASGRIVLGLHAARATEVVDLTECLVLHPTLMALLAPLRTLLGGLRALRRQGSVLMNLLDAGPDLLLRSDASPTPEDRAALAAFARVHGLPRASWAPFGASGVPETLCLLRPPVTALSGITVQPPPGAFLQATASGEQAIVDAVLAGLPARLPGRPRIAELYAGCGTITFALAAARERSLRVVAWEGDAASAAALTRAINQAGLSGRVTAAARDLVRQPLSAKELAGFAAVVLDPPHGGAAPQIREIAAARVPIVVYVSCNPATLGRDARSLRGAGYGLVSATAIDQFLWAARLESVCVFARR